MTMFCRECGSKLNEEQEFCAQCGTPTRKLGQLPDPKRPDRKKGWKHIFFFAVMGLLIVAMAGVGFLLAYRNGDGAPAETAGGLGNIGFGIKAERERFELDLIEPGKLHVATHAEFPPLEMLSGQGEVEGIDIDLIKMVADRLGLELVIENMDYYDIYDAVKNGRADVAISGINQDKAQSEELDTSDIYLVRNQVIVTMADNPAESWWDVSGGRIGCKEGTAAANLVGSYGHEIFPFVMEYKTYETALQALRSGQVPGVAMDEVQARRLVSGTTDLRIVEEPMEYEKYVIVCRKGDKQMRSALNMILEELKAEGVVDQLVAKYIDSY